MYRWYRFGVFNVRKILQRNICWWSQALYHVFIVVYTSRNNAPLHEIYQKNYCNSITPSVGSTHRPPQTFRSTAVALFFFNKLHMFTIYLHKHIKMKVLSRELCQIANADQLICITSILTITKRRNYIKSRKLNLLPLQRKPFLEVAQWPKQERHKPAVRWYRSKINMANYTSLCIYIFWRRKQTHTIGKSFSSKLQIYVSHNSQ
jgi:hypothetical protein